MTYKKKLIEVALPLEAINKEAARSKRKAPAGYPTTLHKWWAQRPLAACRAVLFASLVDDPSECVAELMKDSVKRKAAEKELKARKKLWDQMTAVLEKARAGGISAPPPGPEPKLGEIIAEIERERLFAIIRELVQWENSNNERVLNAARAEILRSCNGTLPPVYDPFCGGGSIPLEAQRLGLEVHASDLNPIPVLITKALIEIPHTFTGKAPVNPESRRKLGASGSWRGAAGLAEDIRYYGQWLSVEAEKRIGHLFPKVRLPNQSKGKEATVVAWLWARTVECPNPICRARAPLLRSFWLSKKKEKQIYAMPLLDREKRSTRFEIRTEGQPPKHTSDRTGARCLFCEGFIKKAQLRSISVEHGVGIIPIAMAVEGDRGRFYLASDIPYSANDQLPNIEFLQQSITNDKRWFSPPLYGLTKFEQLFTPRQILAHSAFRDLLPEVRELVRNHLANSNAGSRTETSDNGAAYADAIVTYLAIAMSRCIDYGNTICSWRAKDNAMRSGFSKQAIPMVWDFAEGNPFGDSSAGFAECVKVVARCLEHTPLAPQRAQVCTRDAATPINGGFVYSTDPPYYANIGYADLSDFFYIWLRRALASTYPELFQTMMVPKSDELVAVPIRHGGDKSKAQAFFEEGLGRAFTAMRASALSDFPVTVYYAFKQTEEGDDEDTIDEDPGEAGAVSTGWETMLSGLIGAGFCIDGTWPMRTEGDNRQVGIGTNALASSIVLVCRPRPKEADMVSRRDFLAALKRELPDALRAMQKSNIAPVDLAQAAIGPGMAVFSRYARVLETDGSAMTVRAALTEINKSLDEVLTEQEGEFDADTRWALAWFDQNGFNEGAYGVAETLCTAKNTSVQGMKDAGILEAKGGKVRLLKKEELDADWNPTTDKRLTIWEITHQLIRRLEQGESGAAELIQQLGAKAEVARDLSYRLYTICERRKWAQEAIAYNALVLSWSDVQRLAQEKKAAAPTQGEMQL